MDRLDTRILRRLLDGGADFGFTSDFRRSFRAMARELHVDEGTIRNRLRRFEESGFIQRWRLRVNPRLWGGGIAGVWMDVSRASPREALVDKLKLVPGVDVITLFDSSLVTILLRYPDEPSLRSRVELFRAIVNPEGLGWGRLVLPPCDMIPMRSDWEILQCLENDPRKPCQQVANELGLSSRTVTRRLRQLVQRGAAFASADLDFDAVRGAVMASLLVFCQDSQCREIGRRIAAHLDLLLWHTFLLVPLERAQAAVWGFALALPNVGKTREILARVQGFPSVVGARIDLFEEVINRRHPESSLHGPLGG